MGSRAVGFLLLCSSSLRVILHLRSPIMLFSSIFPIDVLLLVLFFTRTKLLYSLLNHFTVALLLQFITSKKYNQNGTVPALPLITAVPRSTPAIHRYKKSHKPDYLANISNVTFKNSHSSARTPSNRFNFKWVHIFFYKTNFSLS